MKVGYSLYILPACQKDIKKLTKKDHQLKIILEKKITEILYNPTRYKPLRNDLTGYYRVHVMSSFVLIFGVDTVEETVTLVRFSHHDDAYDR